MSEKAPLVAHVIHHLYIGGMENGLVNLINRMPRDCYRHAVICIVDHSDFRERITRTDVEIFAMHKKPGKDFRLFFRLFRLIRQLRPTIVHSRNLSGLDSLVPATVAGVPCIVHGEHGRDVDDLEGANKKMQLLRRLHKPFVDLFVPLSKDLERYLVDKIKVPNRAIRQIYNGVDIKRFHPRGCALPQASLMQFAGHRKVLFGTVGRLQPVKNQMLLLDAFALLIKSDPSLSGVVRLVIVGDGPSRAGLENKIEKDGLSEFICLAGAHDDIPNMLNNLDVFVLPSLVEGISNTILEAMASGVPVVATDVGGNRELVSHNETGMLVASQNAEEMARAMGTYVRSTSLRKLHGRNARQRAVDKFSLDTMVKNYMNLYQELIELKC